MNLASNADHEAILSDVLRHTVATIGRHRIYLQVSPEHSSNYCWSVDYLSPGCEALYGYTAEEFIANPDLWRSRVHPEDWQSVILPNFALAYSTPPSQRQTIRVEYRIFHKDGCPRWIAETITLMRDESAEYCTVTTIALDITDRKQMEETLRQSEATNRAILQAIPDLLIQMRRDGSYLNRLSGQFVQSCPMPKDLHQCTVYDVLPANLADQRMEYIHRAIATQTLQIYEHQLAVKGELRHEEVRIIALNSEEVLVMVRDISEQQELERKRQVTEAAIRQQAEQEARLHQRLQQFKTENALHQSQRKYQHLVNSIDAIVWEANTEFQYTFVSQQVERILGYSPEQCLEPDFWIAHLHPEDCDRMIAFCTENIKQQQDHTSEYRMIAADGHTVWIRDTTNVILDNGQVQKIQGILIDISDRKTIEHQLRQNQAMLAAAQRVARVGNWEYDVTRDEQNWSQETYHIFGLEPTQAAPTYQELLDLIHPDDREWVASQNTLEQCVQAGKMQPFEHRLIRPDGQIRSVEVRGEPILNEQGQIVKLFGTVLDITDRKQVESQLQQVNETLAIANAELARANRLKDEFLANMSHELRTPLSSILGLSEVLQSEAFGALSEKQQQFVDTIYTSGKHLLALINDILDLAKIESGKFEMELAPASLHNICESSLMFVQQQAQQKRILLNSILPPDYLLVQVDERRLRQVLINLLSNGVKFTPEGGRVTLEVEVNPTLNLCCFKVIDTGIGIAATDIHQLFQPFVQIDSSLSRRFEGSGLGLALVKQIVQRHGGSVNVNSSPGQGSCFTVTLPLWVAGEEEIQREQGAAELTTHLSDKWSIGQGERQGIEPELSDSAEAPLHHSHGASPHPQLLLVDDNPDTQLLLKDFFQIHGFHVIVANNGMEALRLAQRYLPQIIVMDVQMPGMDGLETTRQLRQQPQTATIPVIVLTALAMQGDRDRCLAAGATDYLSKPMQLQALLVKVNELLGF